MASTELSRKELTALQKRARRLWQDVTLHLQCVIGEHHPPETVTQFREGVQVMHKIAVTVANEKALAAYEAVRKSKLTKMRKGKRKASAKSQRACAPRQTAKPCTCVIGQSQLRIACRNPMRASENRESSLART